MKKHYDFSKGVQGAHRGQKFVVVGPAKRNPADGYKVVHPDGREFFYSDKKTATKVAERINDSLKEPV